MADALPTGKALPPIPQQATAATPVGWGGPQMLLAGGDDAPAIPTPKETTNAVLTTLRQPLQAIRDQVALLSGHAGDPLDQAITFRMGRDLGFISQQGSYVGGGGTFTYIPGGGGGGPGSAPDLTPPPNVTGFAGTPGLANIILAWDAATYLVGHGPKQTNIYGVKKASTDATLPVFSDAQLLATAPDALTIIALPSDLSIRWHVWAKYETVDGVESVSPAGGSHGVVVQTGKIGNADLGPLIIEAGNLADNSITASKILGGAVDASKLAVIFGGTNLLTNSGFGAKTTSGLVTVADSWNPYTAGSMTGQGFTYNSTSGPNNGPVQRWGGNINATGQIGIYQNVAIVPVPTAGGKVALSAYVACSGPQQIQLLAFFKDGAGTVLGNMNASFTPTGTYERYSFVGSAPAGTTNAQVFFLCVNPGAPGSFITTAIAKVQMEVSDIVTGWAPRPSEILPGTITQTEIADNSITTPKLVAGAVVAGTIAAGAVGADKIAANAITTDKLVVTGRGKALNDDPSCSDATAWPGAVAVAFTAITDGIAGASAMRMAGAGTSAASRPFPASAGLQYKVSCFSRQAAGGSGATYIRLYFFNAAGTLLQYIVTAIQPVVGAFEGVAPTTSWTKYVGTTVAPAGTVTAQLIVVGNYGGSGTTDFQDLRAEEYIGADLIVDGSIFATKLAANSIAVGTAAIQAGAIVNFMFGAGSIDDAKIANLSAAKLTAGDGTIGGNLKSANYAANSTGWIVRPDGFAEFGFAHIRGTLQASQVSAGLITAAMIDSRGLSIKDSAGNVILSAGTALDTTYVKNNDPGNFVKRPAFVNGADVGQWGSGALVGYPYGYPALVTGARDTIENGNTVPVQGGERLYVRASISTVNTGLLMGIGVFAYNASGTIVGFLLGATLPAGTAGFNIVSGYVDLPSDAAYVTPWAHMSGFSGFGSGYITNMYVGRSQPGATVGATFGINIGGQITAANAATFIASGAINVAAINGLGGLATQSSVDYSGLTGTKPPTNADNTASNIAAGIAGQGAFATLNGINAGNASTYIANAAIGTALIGAIGTSNLSVATLSSVINSGATFGQRVEIQSNVIRVIDASNVTRVKLGDLS